MGRYHDYLRSLYRGGRPNRWAKVQNRASAPLFSTGVWPSRLAALEVRGRLSGRPVVLPVVIADHDGGRFLVAMLGERSNWVANVRAANGQAVLRHGRRERVSLQEVEVSERPPIIRRYLQVAPGGRPHIPVDRDAPTEDFERVAANTPVFRINSLTSPSS